MFKNLRKTPSSKILENEKSNSFESMISDLKKGKVSPYVLPGLYVTRNITPETIISLVSSYLHVPEKDMFKKSRKRDIVYARSLCYVLLKEFKVPSCETFSGIGRFFKKDHSTILHNYNQIIGLAQIYPVVAGDIKSLMSLTKEVFSRAEGSSYILK